MFLQERTGCIIQCVVLVYRDGRPRVPDHRTTITDYLAVARKAFADAMSTERFATAAYLDGAAKLQTRLELILKQGTSIEAPEMARKLCEHIKGMVLSGSEVAGACAFAAALATLLLADSSGQIKSPHARLIARQLTQYGESAIGIGSWMRLTEVELVYRALTRLAPERPVVIDDQSTAFAA